MAKLIGIIVGVSTFALWLSVVGNPHVVETVIGVVLGCITGFWSFFSLKKFSRS